MTNKIWDINSRARVIGYGRVSTEKQENNTSLTVQEEAYERDKIRYGWIGPSFIKESGSGTSIQEREGIKEVLQLVRNGEVDAVWVIDQDRLCRPEDLRDLAVIYDIFADNDVKLVTPSRTYDLRVDNDAFSFDLEGVLAKHNRRRLLQNMNRGKIATAKEGKNAGGAAPDGYIVDPKTGQYTIDPDRANYAKLAWDLTYHQDFTLRKLVEEFDRRGIRSKSGKKWSLTHFHDMFFNEEYIGKYIYGKFKSVKDRKTGRTKRVKRQSDEWIIVNNAHPPLINEQIFYGVQEKLSWRRKRINYNTHLLTGIGTCYQCGAPLHVKFSNGGQKAKYVCTDKKKGCRSRWIDLTELNKLVWDKFKVLLENPYLIEKFTAPQETTEYRLRVMRERLKKIQDEIDKVETKKNRLLDLYLDNKFSKIDLDDKSNELDKNIKALRKDYDIAATGIRALEEQPNDLAEIMKYMRILCYSESRLTYDQKVRIFRHFVHKVRLNERLEFVLELYRAPIGEVPEHFRTFPRELKEEIPVQGSVLNSFGNVLATDILTASQVTYSSAHL